MPFSEFGSLLKFLLFGATRNKIIKHIGDDAALVLPQVLARLPVVRVLNHDAQLEIILKHALGYRTVDTHVGAFPVGPTPHLVPYPSRTKNLRTIVRYSFNLKAHSSDIGVTLDVGDLEL